MKKFTRFALFALLTSLLALTSCDELGQDQVEPTAEEMLKDASLRVKVTSTNISEATVQVNFAVVNELAYTLVQADLTSNEKVIPTVDEIFTNGTAIELTEGQSVVRVNLTNLEPDSGYIIYVAGRLKVEDKVYSLSVPAEASLMTYAQPVMEAQLVSVGTTAAKFAITSNRISRYAYLCYLTSEVPAEIPSADLIFATGVMGEITDATTEVTINALMPNKEYVVYVAGEIAEMEEYFEKVTTIEPFVTQDFRETYQIHSIGYNNFKIDLKLPDSIKELNHAVKWAMLDLYTYNLSHKFGRNGAAPDSWAHTINLHDDVYDTYITESQTMEFSNYTAFKRDEHGEIYYDEEYDTHIQLHSIMVPGQPNMLVMGEYAHGDHYLYANFTDGYYLPLFLMNDYRNAYYADPSVANNQLPWWYGFAIEEQVNNLQPEPYDGNVKFELLLSEDNNNTKAKVRFTPTDNVDQYCVWIITESMRQEVLPMLDNDEKYFQWFITSESGFNEGAMSLSGAKELYLNDGGTPDDYSDGFNFYDAVLTNTKNKFHVYITAMGGGDQDGDGICDATLQTFYHEEFKLGEPRLPAPKVDVTVLPSTSDKVRFNIKKAEGSSQIREAYYIANYEREWLGAGMPPEMLLDYYGNPISTAELAMINSDEGYTIEIPSRPNATTYFAMKVYNGESYYSYTDTFKAVSAVTSAENKVESDYFTSLNGDWTATATLQYKAVVDEDTGEIQTLNKEKSSKITIGQQTYAETLPQSVYDTYKNFGISKEATDNYYAELTEAIDLFNEDVRNRNQVTCTGWEFDYTGEAKDTYLSAYDLFCSSTYNGWSSISPLYDFGPKWYIEFDANGNAWVPFNINKYIPMSSWSTTETSSGAYVNEYHMVAYDTTTPALYPYFWDADNNIVDGKFPVEISEDGNTITIKPLEINGIKFYPNMGSVYSQDYTQFIIASSVVSEIVLTRGWNDENASAPAKVATKPQVANNYHKVSPVKRTREMTNFTTPVTVHELVAPMQIRTGEQYLEDARKRYEIESYNR